MVACLDRILCCFGRGTPALSYSVIIPFATQPLIALATVAFAPSTPTIKYASVSIVVAQVLIACYMAKRNAHSQFLYYWVLASVAYSIILFESSVTPLLEIRWEENLIVVLLATGALVSFYMAKEHATRNASGERMNGALLGNGVYSESICPVCRIKVYPRCVHCHICHTCIPRLDHHCFWLDCCIGENNQGLFMTGLLLGILSVIYGSLLTLTSICRPEFIMGVLLPSDCSDVADDLEMGVCYMSAVYCLALAVPATLQLLHHCWLVSRGLSGEEWRLQKYSICASSPYSRRFLSNWVTLARGVVKVRQ